MKDIFVVEGKNDVLKLKTIIDNPLTITTNGFALNDITLAELKELSKTARIVLLLDPDGPGEKIRRRINDNIDNCVNVFVKKDKAISKNRKKVGIEHVDRHILKEALKDFKGSVNSTDITAKDIYKLGLSGQLNSKEKRIELCNELNIGYASAKTLLYKFNLFGINYKDLEGIIKK